MSHCPQPVPCLHCGAPVQGRRADAIYCGPICNAAARRRRDAHAEPAAPAAPTPGKCLHCGRALSGQQRMFCSRAHKTAFRDAGRTPPQRPPAHCRRCHKPCPPGRWVFCSTACGRADFQARSIQRAREAGGDALRLIRMLREETPAGYCPHCDRPLPKGRRVRCGDVECRRLYDRDYAAARRNPPEEARG